MQVSKVGAVRSWWRVRHSLAHPGRGQELVVHGLLEAVGSRPGEHVARQTGLRSRLQNGLARERAQAGVVASDELAVSKGGWSSRAYVAAERGVSVAPVSC